ncbi:hypothetical protein FCIRC_11680 [Fusarium circinatum]|uniref:Uncharacterized protein n=1 Tax=Fusarium circinatum TaxID=48490 RepID=A0A8H5WGL2_FUSCI|nr:hypothetical protein FCIRC_11680 [Fusarium circinatum]
MVADLKVGPRSRRSSASSRKSGDSDITNLIEDEAADSFIANDDVLTIFQAFLTATGIPINVRKVKKTLEYGGRFRDEAIDMMKESWNPDTLGKRNRRSPCRARRPRHHATLQRLERKHRDQKAQGKGKKAVVQTRTESFHTAIDGDTTPHRQGEKRNAQKTPATRRQWVNPFLVSDGENEEYTGGNNQPKNNGESSSSGLG